MAVLLTGTTIGGHSAIHAGNLATHGIITTSNISSSALSLSGGTLTGQLNLHAGSYEGSIVFGSQAVWRTGIRQHDDGDAELRIWAKNANGMIFIATGYDGEPASISRPTDGLAIQGNKLGIGDFSAADPLYKLHVKGDIYANGGWVRVSGSEGLYFESYGGGWRMTDSTWIRAYNDKNIYTAGTIQAATFSGALSGNATTATTLATARTITIGATGKTFNGSGNVSWSLGEIQAEYEHPSGVPRNNLGSPTVREMALFNEQFNNKTAFLDPSRVTVWKQQTNGAAWEDITANYSQANIRRFIAGYDSSANIFIPNGVYSFRIEVTHPNYVFANAVYFYWSSNSHSTKLHLWARRTDNQNWYQWTSSTTDVSSWPGHLYMPFSSIAWHPSASTTSHYNALRFEFIPAWQTSNPTYANTNIDLYKMQVWGGYPAGTRFPYSVNEYGDFTTVRDAYSSSGKLATESYVTSRGYITGYTETDTLATVTGRGATTASQLSFTKTDDHAISVGTIRGRAVGSQTGEFIHLYERVHIGSPSGWGGGNTAAPSYGLSVYGGATIGYGNSGGLTVTGTLSATNFSGTSSGTNTGDQTTITGNAGSATVLQTARTLTIGATGKTFNGSANVSWTLAEIGAQAAGSYAAASHTHDDRYYTETESDNRFVRKDTTGQYLKPYNEYTSNLPASSVASSIVSQMGGGGLRVDFLSNASFGSWAHAISFSGYSGYNMYQLAGHYKGSGGEGPDLYVRCEPNHGQSTWSSWEKLWHTGNDGAGSGLDADLLDGNHASAFYLATNPSGYITGSYLDDYTRGSYRVISDYGSNSTWYIRSNGQFIFGTGHDWTASFRLSIDNGSGYGNNGSWAYFGQQDSNSTNGTWRGVRIRKYAGGNVDGDLSAGAFYIGDTRKDLLWDTAYNWGNHAGLYAAASHTHTIANVTGLQAALDGKQAAGSYLTSFTETNTFLGDGGNGNTHPGTSRLIFTGQLSQGTDVLGMPTTDNSNTFLNINRHPGEYNSQLGFSSNGNMYYRSFSNAAINSTQAWRTVWDSGNLTNLNQLTNGPGYITGNQTVTLSGDVSGSGTTSIAVTVNNIDGWGFVNTGSNSGTNADTINSNGISYYTGGVTNFSGNATDGALYSQRYSDSWQHQIAGDYRSGQIALRGKNSGTWQAWRTVLDSSNFSTWAQPAGSYAAASHTHDDRYYTETESDGRFLKLAGGTTTGTVVMNGDNYLNGGLSGIKNIHYQYSGIGYTVTNGAAAWYRIAKLDNFGAGILILGFTNNGSINEVIYEITYWLGEGDNATIDLRKFGVDDYVTEARIVKNNSLYYIEAYFAAAPTTPQTYHSPEIFNVRTLGTNLNKVITVYTGNLSVTSGTQTTLVTKAFIDNGNTFSVTNATNATSTLAGLAVHSGRNNEADKVVRTDVNGYIQAGWINTTSGNTTSTITDIYVNTNDGYIRKATPAHFRSQITDGVYAPVSHTHSIANVTGLQSALDGKQASGSYLTSLGFSYSTGVTANHVVQRDANGYIYANHINFSTGETENPTISSFFVSNGDGWSRKASVAHVKSQLGLGSAAYVATSTFADASHTHTFASLTSKPTTISGYGITDAITTGNIGSQSVSRASGVSITGFGTDSFTYHQTPGNVHSWTGGWASHFIGNHGNGDTYYSQSIIMPFWGVPRYQRNEGGTKVGPWQFITEENIATQSVSFATTSGSATSSTTANRLDNYGINYGSDWNTWGVSGKLVASSYHDASGANKPPTYTYGSFLSFLNAGADSFQIAIPENQFNGTGKQRAMHFRSAWNGTWSSWRQVVDIQNNVCDILADGNSTLIVRQGVGYNQPFNSNIEIHGSVDDWAYGKFRFRVQNEAGTEPVYGAQFRIERFSVNTGWQLLGMVPRGSQNLEWQGDILPGLSDQRVKENVVSLTDGVATIQQINPVEFDWKPVENVSEREGHDIGFIAQQLEEIVPTAVHTRSDGYKTVKYEKVVPILVQAIKEQQSLIEQLTARIEALENR